MGRTGWDAGAGADIATVPLPEIPNPRLQIPSKFQIQKISLSPPLSLFPPVGLFVSVCVHSWFRPRCRIRNSKSETNSNYRKRERTETGIAKGKSPFNFRSGPEPVARQRPPSSVTSVSSC